MFDQHFCREEVANQNPFLQFSVHPETGFILPRNIVADLETVPMMRNKHDYYYDAMDFISCGDLDKAIRLLKKALDIDEYYVAAYIGLSIAYFHKDNKKKEREYTEKAFAETKRKFSKWPDKMIWAELDNREYLRAIEQKASLLWQDNNKKEAEELYRLLLKLNPNDNQGIRYILAGFYAGLSEEEIDKMWNKANEEQSWSTMDLLLAEQNAKHHFWQIPSEE